MTNQFGISTPRMDLFRLSHIAIKNLETTHLNPSTIQMNMIRTFVKSRLQWTVTGLVALLTTFASNYDAQAAKPPLIPSWYEGRIEYFTVVSENVLGVDYPGLESAAIPLYAFGFPPVQAQSDIIGLIPGDAGYNPWWKVILVVPLSPRDLSTDPYTSEAELLQAAAGGQVTLIETEFYFMCQVLPNR